MISPSTNGVISGNFGVAKVLFTSYPFGTLRFLGMLHIRGRIPVSTVTEFHCGDPKIPQVLHEIELKSMMGKWLGGCHRFNESQHGQPQTNILANQS